MLQHYISTQQLYSYMQDIKHMLTADWPAARSRWAWPGRQSRDRGYRWAGWPATWIHAFAMEDSRIPHILLWDCSAWLPANREKEKKAWNNLKERRRWQNRWMEEIWVLVCPTRNWGRGSSRDSAGVSSVPHLYASSAPLLFHRSRNRVAHTTLNSANTTQQMSRLVWNTHNTNTQRRLRLWSGNKIARLLLYSCFRR